MIFIQAWIKAIRATGMYPFNLSIIPSETFAPVALSQNDSPVPARSVTDAPAERNPEMYSPCGAVERGESGGSSQGTHKKNDTSQYEIHYEAFYLRHEKP